MQTPMGMQGSYQFQHQQGDRYGEYPVAECFNPGSLFFVCLVGMMFQ